MRHLKWLLLLLLAMPAFGQAGNTVIIRFAGAPSGSCSPIAVAVNNATGDFYDCLSAAWHQVGAAGSGTVNAGTTGQFAYYPGNAATVSGSGPITTNFLPKGNAATAFAVSLLSDDGTTLTYSGTGGFSATGTNGGLTLTEGTGAGLTPGAGVDVCFGDSTAHRVKCNNNATGNVILSGISAAATAGNMTKFAANGIDVADSGSPSTVTTTGYIIPTSSFPTILTTSAPADTQNELGCIRFVAPFTITATRFTYLLAATAGAGTHVGFAIYDTTGASTRLMTTGAQDGTSVGQHIITVSSFTLQGGTAYLFCWTTDSATPASWQVYGVNDTSATIANLINANTINKVKGATASSAGAPPTTTGALTAKTGSGTIPLAFIEP